MKSKLIKINILLTVFILLFGVVYVLLNGEFFGLNHHWQVRSIDTMKYSRDKALSELNNPKFDEKIDAQVKQISETGANYIAIDTPYDEQFYPFLKRWVVAARKYDLKVWFRGNWSGWEGWFEYAKIDRATHLANTKEFILKHGDIFENGDIFTACPECENGGPGDPRDTGDVKGFRQFMIDEYHITQDTFKQIGKNVTTNYNSMNGDVATLIMDKQTTKTMGGIVSIDHYTKNPGDLATKVNEIHETSGGKVVVGEFGAPIPDINGKMNEEEQSGWIENALNTLSKTPNVEAVNYWTNKGSTTSLWNEDGSERLVVNIITMFYKKTILF